MKAKFASIVSVLFLEKVLEIMRSSEEATIDLAGGHGRFESHTHGVWIRLFFMRIINQATAPADGSTSAKRKRRQQ